jgi:hypothetical protein
MRAEADSNTLDIPSEAVVSPHRAQLAQQTVAQDDGAQGRASRLIRGSTPL